MSNYHFFMLVSSGFGQRSENDAVAKKCYMILVIIIT